MKSYIGPFSRSSPQEDVGGKRKRVDKKQERMEMEVKGERRLGTYWDIDASDQKTHY